MTQKEFIEILKKKKYSYEIEGDQIVVTGGDKDGGDVRLNALTSLPPGVVFENGGSVWLNDLTSLPLGVEFENEGYVYLSALTSLPSGVEFKNGGPVNLRALTSLPPGVVFKNGGNVWLRALIGGGFSEWSGNIKGIGGKRLLNVMIKRGIFER
jgi:hypothetical protein